MEKRVDLFEKARRGLLDSNGRVDARNAVDHADNVGGINAQGLEPRQRVSVKETGGHKETRDGNDVGGKEETQVCTVRVVEEGPRCLVQV